MKINKKLYQKVVGVALVGSMLYATGVMGVLGSFWRTALNNNPFSAPINANQFQYGYGYGSLGWGYGYGYGYGYGAYNQDGVGYYYSSEQSGTGAYSNPTTVSTGNISSVSTISGTTTAATQITFTTTAQFNPTGSIKAVLPAGLVITNASGGTINTTQLAAASLSTLSVSLASGESDQGKMSFGVPGIKLNFSKPVKLEIPVSGYTGSTISIKVKHATDSGYSTGALTNNASASCSNGIPTSNVSNVATVSSGVATIYTCSASEFVAYTPAVVSDSNNNSSSSGGGGGGGGSIANVLGTTVVSGSNVTTQEISTVQNQIAKLTTTTKGMTVNGVSVSIETPKFNSTTDQKAIETLNKIVLDTISKKKITGKDLEKAIEYYNKVIGAVKLTKDGGDSTASKVAAYYMSEFNKIVTSYNDITPSKKLKDPEFEYALAMMNKNGLTKYTSVDAYRPNDGLTRQEASKFFVEFAKKVLGKSSNVTLVANNCEFNDLAKADPSLKPYITEACKLGLLKGSNGKFMPFDKMTKAQAVAVLVRAIVGKSLDETTIPWFKNYYEKAKELGLIKDKSITGLDKNLTRYEAGLMLYRSNK